MVFPRLLYIRPGRRDRTGKADEIMVIGVGICPCAEGEKRKGLTAGRPDLHRQVEIQGVADCFEKIGKEDLFPFDVGQATVCFKDRFQIYTGFSVDTAFGAVIGEVQKVFACFLFRWILRPSPFGKRRSSFDISFRYMSQSRRNRSSRSVSSYL